MNNPDRGLIEKIRSEQVSGFHVSKHVRSFFGQLTNLEMYCQHHNPQLEQLHFQGNCIPPDIRTFYKSLT